MPTSLGYDNKKNLNYSNASNTKLEIQCKYITN